MAAATSAPVTPLGNVSALPSGKVMVTLAGAADMGNSPEGEAWGVHWTLARCTSSNPVDLQRFFGLMPCRGLEPGALREICRDEGMFTEVPMLKVFSGAALAGAMTLMALAPALAAGPISLSTRDIMDTDVAEGRRRNFVTR